MLRQKVLNYFFATMFVASPIILFAYVTGPDPGHTGAPGDDQNGCATSGCHTGTGNPTKGSGVNVTFSDGTTYTPGSKQTITVVIATTQSKTNGFQMTARVSADNSNAGTFTSNDNFTQVICGALSNGVGQQVKCPNAPAYIEHTQAGSQTSGQWSFTWTPPATNVGPVTFYVAGNAANGNGTQTGDKIYMNTFTLTPKTSSPPPPQIRTSQPVLEAFLGGPRISPGTWIEIYGTGLAPSTQLWDGLFTNNNTVAPTTINGVTVTVDGKQAFLYYTSDAQINAQVPDGIGQGNVVVQVNNANGSSTATVASAAVSPAMLTNANFLVNGTQWVAALHSDGTFVGKAGLITGLSLTPAKPGEIITIYAVGCGVTTPTTPAGTVVSGALKTVPNVQVTIGQSVATTAAAMSPGAIGLCQMNVTVPTLAAGDYPIEATVAGVPTGQGLKITVQP